MDDPRMYDARPGVVVSGPETSPLTKEDLKALGLEKFAVAYVVTVNTTPTPPPPEEGGADE